MGSKTDDVGFRIKSSQKKSQKYLKRNPVKFKVEDL